MTTFIRLPEVIARTGLKRSSIYKFVNQGTFPPQIPLGERAVAWDSEAVDRWMEERIQAAQVQRNMRTQGQAA